MLKDRGTLFQLFILPLLFILVFSGALSAIGESEAVSLPTLRLHKVLPKSLCWMAVSPFNQHLLQKHNRFSMKIRLLDF
jgi:hypothetical protein